MYYDWLNGFIGGSLIGLAGAGMLISIGRIMGVSGIIGGLLRPQEGDVLWRGLFLLGIAVGGLILLYLQLPYFKYEISRTLLQVGAGGFLVGFGTLLGNGCTSGHGVCGVSRLSPRSLLATSTFILSGIGAVSFMNYLNSV